jgi:hypothetical protein
VVATNINTLMRRTEAAEEFLPDQNVHITGFSAKAPRLAASAWRKLQSGRCPNMIHQGTPIEQQLRLAAVFHREDKSGGWGSDDPHTPGVLGWNSVARFCRELMLNAMQLGPAEDFSGGVH